MIQSKDFFMINGVSNSEINVYADTPPVLPMASQRYTTVQTGADEDITSPDGTYEDISYSLTFFTFDRENFDNSDIYAFFANAQTLQTSRLPQYYMKIKKVNEIVPENVSKGLKIRYTANLTLAPFKYLVDNPEIEIQNSDIVHNSGTRYSRPTFRIVGTGDIKLNVNGEIFEVKGLTANQEVIIDSSRYITYSASDLFFNRTRGKYPFLAVGDNLVSWEGSINSVKITKNERCY